MLRVTRCAYSQSSHCAVPVDAAASELCLGMAANTLLQVWPLPLRVIGDKYLAGLVQQQISIGAKVCICVSGYVSVSCCASCCVSGCVSYYVSYCASCSVSYYVSYSVSVCVSGCASCLHLCLSLCLCMLPTASLTISACACVCCCVHASTGVAAAECWGIGRSNRQCRAYLLDARRRAWGSLSSRQVGELNTQCHKQCL